MHGGGTPGQVARSVAQPKSGVPPIHNTYSPQSPRLPVPGTFPIIPNRLACPHRVYSRLPKRRKEPPLVDSDQMRLDRRAMLRKGSALVASFATIPIVVWSKAGRAAKADRVALRYQDQPKNGKICADCWDYVAGPNPAEGTCKAIEGPISAHGWCMAFSPKQRRTRTGKNTWPNNTVVAILPIN
jgi:High potential iron-sulfur protein